MSHVYGADNQNHAPSWWGTARVTDATASWFLLFEYFPINAEPFALLRLTLSGHYDTSSSTVKRDMSYERTISTDALFTSTSISDSDPSRSFRRLIDDHQNNKIQVSLSSKPSSPQSVTVTVTVAHLSIQLHHPISLHEFISRVSTYAAYVHSSERDARNDFENACEKREQIQRKLDKSVQDKIHDDRRLRLATAILMREKRKRPKA